MGDVETNISSEYTVSSEKKNQKLDEDGMVKKVEEVKKKVTGIKPHN